jgi:hypothetical protein
MKKITFLNILFFSFCAFLTNNSAISQNTSVSLEAECGTVGSLWDTIDDVTVSGNKYVTVKPGNTNSASATEDSADHVSFTFNISEDGNYVLWIRAFTPNSSDDSFYIRVDGGQWNTWNQIVNIIPDKNDWGWVSKFSYDLTAGIHTLSIAYREDGALLDKIYLTKDGDNPTGLGNGASNCSALNVKEQTNEAAQIIMYPNPVSDILSIYLPKKENKPTILSVYNTNGSLVKTITGKNGENKVNIKNLNTGLYFVVFNLNNKIYTRKFVKE